jgi:hypothetical protein
VKVEAPFAGMMNLILPAGVLVRCSLRRRERDFYYAERVVFDLKQKFPKGLTVAGGGGFRDCGCVDMGIENIF